LLYRVRLHQPCPWRLFSSFEIAEKDVQSLDKFTVSGRPVPTIGNAQIAVFGFRVAGKFRQMFALSGSVLTMLDCGTRSPQHPRSSTGPAARMFDLEGTPDKEVREGLGTGFPKHPLHKIGCIGALVAGRRAEGWQIQALGAPHIGQRSETDLIRSFIDRIGELRPQLITFNGHSFDFAVLR
jgi:hypothetical protein